MMVLFNAIMWTGRTDLKLRESANVFTSQYIESGSDVL